MNTIKFSQCIVHKFSIGYNKDITLYLLENPSGGSYYKEDLPFLPTKRKYVKPGSFASVPIKSNLKNPDIHLSHFTTRKKAEQKMEILKKLLSNNNLNITVL